MPAIRRQGMSGRLLSFCCWCRAREDRREGAATRGTNEATTLIFSRSRTTQKKIQCSLELLLAGCVDDPADFQTVASLPVKYSVVASVDPAADLGTGGDLPAGARVGSELLEGLPKTTHVAASLILTEPLGSVLPNFFEVSGRFGAEGETALHPS